MNIVSPLVPAKNVHLFEFDHDGNAIPQPEYQAVLDAYVAFIRENISTCPDFYCHVYREKDVSGLNLFLGEESFADLSFKISGYSHIPQLSQDDLTMPWQIHDHIKEIRSTCHFIDSTDMLLMASYLIQHLNATQFNSIEKVETSLWLASKPENGGYQIRPKVDSKCMDR